MSVFAVTARSTGGLRPANLPGKPTGRKVIPFPKRPVPRLPTVTPKPPTKAARAAVKVLARKLAPRILPLAGPAIAAAQAIWFVYDRYIEPSGFPGWGSINAAWTSHGGVPIPGASPGDYTANGFDRSPYQAGNIDGLIDTNDGSAIFGFRYWGHYPNQNPLPDGAPGQDWVVQPQWFPAETPAPAPAGLPARAPAPGISPEPVITPLRRYNPQRDLAPRLRPQTRWQPKSNVLIEIALPGPAGRLAPDVVFRTNTPRVKGGLENKAKPKNQFIYAVMKTIANAGGEAKEWIDILAEASDYISGSLITPKEYRDGNRETAAKAWWLFRAGNHCG